MNDNNPIRLTCPTCQKSVVWNEASLYRPFCSARCRTLDLGAWASDSYGIACEKDENGFVVNEDEAHDY